MLNHLMSLFRKKADPTAQIAQSARFTQRTRKAIEGAFEIATTMGANQLETQHLLLSLLHDSGSIAYRVLNNLQITGEGLAKHIEYNHQESISEESVNLSDATQQVFAESVLASQRLGDHFVGTEHLLYGLIAKPDPTIAAILENFKTTPSDVTKQIESVMQVNVNSD